jgi:hypothetical protein
MSVPQLTPAKAFDDIAIQLGERNVDAALVRVLQDFAENHTVEICAKGTSVLPLSAARDAYAAVYVGRSNMSVALDPAVAKRISVQNGLRLEPKTNVTSYVHFHADDLADSEGRERAAEALERAFTRAFKGPRWSRGLVEQGQGDVCQKCNLQKSINGTCDNCD